MEAMVPGADTGITVGTVISTIRTAGIPMAITAAIPTVIMAGILMAIMDGTPTAITVGIPMADTAIIGGITGADVKADRHNRTFSHFVHGPRSFLGLSYL